MTMQLKRIKKKDYINKSIIPCCQYCKISIKFNFSKMSKKIWIWLFIPCARDIPLSWKGIIIRLLLGNDKSMRPHK